MYLYLYLFTTRYPNDYIRTPYVFVFLLFLSKSCETSPDAVTGLLPNEIRRRQNAAISETD